MNLVSVRVRPQINAASSVAVHIVVMDIIVSCRAYIRATTVLKSDAIWIAGAGVVMDVVLAALFLQTDAGACITRNVVPGDLVVVSVMVH